MKPIETNQKSKKSTIKPLDLEEMVNVRSGSDSGGPLSPCAGCDDNCNDCGL